MDSAIPEQLSLACGRKLAEHRVSEQAREQHLQRSLPQLLLVFLLWLASVTDCDLECKPTKLFPGLLSQKQIGNWNLVGFCCCLGGGLFVCLGCLLACLFVDRPHIYILGLEHVM